MDYYGYDYYNSYPTVDTASTAGILGFLGAYSFIMFAVGVLMIVSMWKIFAKAGKEGWKSLIPIYNFVVLLEIVELPIWYILLFFLPFANIYAMFKIYIELAHKFGKSTGFGVASIFFSVICFPILAFGKSRYNGTQAKTSNNTYTQQPVQPQMNVAQPQQPVQPQMNVAQPQQPVQPQMNVAQPQQPVQPQMNVAQPQQNPTNNSQQ